EREEALAGTRVEGPAHPVDVEHDREDLLAVLLGLEALLGEVGLAQRDVLGLAPHEPGLLDLPLAEPRLLALATSAGLLAEEGAELLALVAVAGGVGDDAEEHVLEAGALREDHRALVPGVPC